MARRMSANARKVRQNNIYTIFIIFSLKFDARNADIADCFFACVLSETLVVSLLLQGELSIFPVGTHLSVFSCS